MLKRIVTTIYKLFMSDRQYAHWSQFEYFDPRWRKRVKLMAQFIDDEKSIIDLGCGKMWLKNYLDERVAYFGVDYIKRDPMTIVCDFNNHEYPDLYADACFASGVLEYIDDIDSMLLHLKNICDGIVLSYCTLEMIPDIKYRCLLGWKNNLTRQDLIAKFANAGFNIIKYESTYKNNLLLKLCKQ